MKLFSKTKITGVGAYRPEKRLSNADLETIIDTNDEWIVQRTGIRERRVSAPDEFASDLAEKAARNLAERCGISLDDVDMLIVSTFTPDHFTPHTAALVQGRFGFRAGSLDVVAGCTGFAYSMAVADALISSGHCRKALVIASEAITKVTDYKDRESCILFGDAAVAFMLERTEKAGSVIASFFDSHGDLGHNVTCNNLSRKVNGHAVAKERLFDQEGRAVYSYVVKHAPGGVRKLLERAGLTLDDIAWFIPHSANLRIINSVCEKLGIPPEKTLTSIEKHGNTSSASIPLAIWLALEEGRVAEGDKMLLYGFGGGLTHGGVIIEW